MRSVAVYIFMLSAVMTSFIMLSVVAPYLRPLNVLQGATTLGIKTLSLTAFCTMSLSIKTYFARVSIIDNWHK
jgi:hypothetical protein